MVEHVQVEVSVEVVIEESGMGGIAGIRNAVFGGGFPEADLPSGSSLVGAEQVRSFEEFAVPGGAYRYPRNHRR